MFFVEKNLIYTIFWLTSLFLGQGHGPTALSQIANSLGDTDVLPFGFQGSMTVMCLAHPDNTATRLNILTVFGRIEFSEGFVQDYLHLSLT